METERVCPLCTSGLKYFFINFNEKMLMCQNSECEFPFGHEDLQFRKILEDQDPDFIVDTASYRQQKTASTVMKSSSTEKSKTIEKQKSNEESNQPFETALDVKDFINTTKNEEQKVTPTHTIQQNGVNSMLTQLEEIEAQRKKVKYNAFKPLHNKTLIRELMHLQGQSKCKVLSETEMEMLEPKSDYQFDVSSIKIDVQIENECKK